MVISSLKSALRFICILFCLGYVLKQVPVPLEIKKFCIFVLSFSHNGEICKSLHAKRLNAKFNSLKPEQFMLFYLSSLEGIWGFETFHSGGWYRLRSLLRSMFLVSIRRWAKIRPVCKQLITHNACMFPSSLKWLCS